jgi:Glycine rich protein
VVPPGVVQVTVFAAGAEGQLVLPCVSEGGKTTATIPVTPGETLTVMVGSSDGFNGGGEGLEAANGGGASDVRQGGTSLTDRVVVAGGAGGCAVGAGDAPGGAGGGLTGGTGGLAGCLEMIGGTGGTQTMGGAGGADFIAPPNPGTLGVGGAGEPEDNGQPGGGGGGGGGYYGGGGGGGCGDTEGGGGGGGGGSSYAIPTATGVKMTQGGNAGEGIVTISW